MLAFRFLGGRDGGKPNRAGTRLPPVTSSYAGKVTGRSLGGQSLLGVSEAVTGPNSLALGDITPYDRLAVWAKRVSLPAILAHADPPSLDAGRSEATKMEKAGTIGQRPSRVMGLSQSPVMETDRGDSEA